MQVVFIHVALAMTYLFIYLFILFIYSFIDLFVCLFDYLFTPNIHTVALNSNFFFKYCYVFV